MIQKKGQSKGKRYNVCKRKGALKVYNRGRESEWFRGRVGMSLEGSRVDGGRVESEICVGILLDFPLFVVELCIYILS